MTVDVRIFMIGKSDRDQHWRTLAESDRLLDPMTIPGKPAPARLALAPDRIHGL
jgi:hypothetical protein